ncbi:septum site-determining protein MinC [uncultured Endozoicomonas sp.]|uniref:septum site-determining protein MinC n=1 Tax=uncultured Endozoicomonas sp. TaxID=432652 RepID=UPI002615F65E|nr:septum site-determining protein MinC [uncultured Endozoicomonas sp.]
MTLKLHTGSTTAAFKMTGSIYTLTTLELHTTNPADITTQLETMTRKAPNFFQQTPVIIALESLTAELTTEQSTIDLFKLRHSLQQFGLYLIAVRGGQEKDRQAAMLAGIPWLPSPKQQDKSSHQDEKTDSNVVMIQSQTTSQAAKCQNDTVQQVTDKKTTLIEQPVRSGQQIYAEGDLVITSPVSSGAELLAGGNIHVYGPLRGRALAGVNGNSEARIFCLQFEAELISINGQYKMLSASSDTDNLWGSSVIVALNNQSLHIKKL